MTDPLKVLQTTLADRYAVETEIGSGGMATVYLAEDIKHHRKVAVKVLRADLAAMIGGERFLREIEIAAHLQHPHILPLHDSGEADGILYYVMPFVEGESLRQRLRHELQLPIDEAARIAMQVASALDYAHRQGVIHRDIKPENILLHEGEVMVADFGIALAVTAAGGSRLTETGLSLGTPQYMSPEQATGDRKLDGRSDIYSLGSVLYEMLTGETPHTGPTVQAIIARLVTEKAPTLRNIRETIPGPVERAVMKALSKLPADRYATAGDFADSLQTAISGSGQRAVYQGETLRVSVITSRPLVYLSWGVAAVMTILAALALWAPWRAEPQRTFVTRFATRLSGAQTLDQGSGSPVALSPDGTQLVYSAWVAGGGDGGGGAPLLFRRPMNELEAVPIPGTEGATAPFFSPDGSQIGFFAGTTMKRIGVGGGEPETIAETILPRGASWGANDTIIVGGAPPWEVFSGGLMRVAAAGGIPEVLTQPDVQDDEAQESHYWPQILPDGKSVLFTIWHPRGMRVAVLSLETGEQRTILEPATYARYLPTGHLVYAWNGALRAMPFDVETMEITGPDSLIVPSVAMRNLGSAFFSTSDVGSLVWVPGEAVASEPMLAWVEVTGEVEALPLPLWVSQSPRVAPDGRRLLVMSHSSFHVYDLERGALGAHLPAEGVQHGAVWTPAGDRVIFDSEEAGGAGTLYWASAGGGNVELLARSDFTPHPQSVSPDGGTLLFQQDAGPGTGLDIWMLPLDSQRVPQPVLRTPANEFQPVFSPTGEWIAYISDETGQAEVYVRPFPPEEGDATRVSTGGGGEPVWSPGGDELYYRDQSGSVVMATSFAVGRRGRLRIGEPRVLFTGRFARAEGRDRNFDLSPDGTRFLMIREGAPAPTLNRFDIALNWFDEVRQRIPAQTR